MSIIDYTVVTIETIESEDCFTKAQNTMLGGRKGPR